MSVGGGGGGLVGGRVDSIELAIRGLPEGIFGESSICVDRETEKESGGIQHFYAINLSPSLSCRRRRRRCVVVASVLSCPHSCCH